MRSDRLERISEVAYTRFNMLDILLNSLAKVLPAAGTIRRVMAESIVMFRNFHRFGRSGPTA